MPKITEGANQVDGIPVRWAAAGAPVGLALWLTHLGGSAEQTQPMLTQLAGRGLLAVSFDPPGHGRDAMEMGREGARGLPTSDVASGRTRRTGVALGARLGR
jgi:alpha-beta hydrolase superfamily lysophospholipase